CWRDSYGVFIEQMLRGPLRWLGMVELALDGGIAGTPDAFRVTPQGAALLRGCEPPDLSAPGPPLVLGDDMTARLPIGRGSVDAYRTLERLACFQQVAEGSAWYR